MPALNLAIVGGGVVAGGVVEILQTVPHLFNILYLVVRDKSRPRDFSIPPNTLVTDDLSAVLADPAVDVYCELVGGDSIGRRVFEAATQNRKHYVTANKSFLAENLPFVEAQVPPGCACLFEASVCGGIPVIGLLRRSLCCDEISEIRGIVNGSTNYVLDRMTRETLDYHRALPDAQRLGFLEADPATDVTGLDAKHKILILARLAFGAQIPHSLVPTQGITNISARDMQAAGKMNCCFKLVASAVRKNEKIKISVWPSLVPLAHPLAKIDHCGNAVEIVGKNVGPQFLTGAGAGRFPTANSVVADLLEISRLGDTNYNDFARPLNTELSLDLDIQSVLYIRSEFRPEMACREIDTGIFITQDACSLQAVLQQLPQAFVALVLSACLVVQQPLLYSTVSENRL